MYPQDPFIFRACWRIWLLVAVRMFRTRLDAGVFGCGNCRERTDLPQRWTKLSESGSILSAVRSSGWRLHGPCYRRQKYCYWFWRIKPAVWIPLQSENCRSLAGNKPDRTIIFVAHQQLTIAAKPNKLWWWIMANVEQGDHGVNQDGCAARLVHEWGEL